MKASILDLRYKMKDVLKALDRNETVEVLYHGKPKGTLVPYAKSKQKKISAHPLFGMAKKDKNDVAWQMRQLRGNRYHDI